MAKKEKLLVLMRHGKAEEDVLLPESIERIYKIGASLRKEYFPRGLEPEQCFMWHSGKKRTEFTGKALIRGALELEPSSYLQKELEDNYPLQDPLQEVWIKRSFLLGYDDLEYNEEELEEDEENYMKIWTADNSATEFKGEPITSYGEMMRRGRAQLVDSIEELILLPADFGVLTTHMTIAEPIAMALLNYSILESEKPPTLEDIGGTFGTEQYATFTFGKGKHSEYSKGEFIRDGKEHNINLVKLLNRLIR